MPRAYPGYVYHPYPKMIKHPSLLPLGYKIVKDEKEHQDLMLSLDPPKDPVREPEVPKKKKKLQFDME